jgi:hypothetical protein
MLFASSNFLTVSMSPASPVCVREMKSISNSDPSVWMASMSPAVSRGRWDCRDIGTATTHGQLRPAVGSKRRIHCTKASQKDTKMIAVCLMHSLDVHARVHKIMPTEFRMMHHLTSCTRALCLLIIRALPDKARVPLAEVGFFTPTSVTLSIQAP